MSKAVGQLGLKNTMQDRGRPKKVPDTFLPRDYEGYDANWQRRRFSVRPGITCFWQVNGRSAVPFEKWMALDMLYIDRRSLGLDLKILAQTIPAVLYINRWSLGLDLKILAQTIPAVMRGSGAA